MEYTFLFQCIYIAVLLVLVGASVFLDRAARINMEVEQKQTAKAVTMKRIAAVLYILVVVGILLFILLMTGEPDAIE